MRDGKIKLKLDLLVSKSPQFAHVPSQRCQKEVTYNRDKNRQVKVSWRLLVVKHWCPDAQCSPWVSWYNNVAVIYEIVAKELSKLMHYFIINQAHRDYETYSSSLTTTKTAEQRRNRFCKALQTWELKLMTKSRKRSTNWILITMVKWPIRTLYKASCWRKESSSSRRQLEKI